MNFIRLGSLFLLAWPMLGISAPLQKSSTLENYSAEKGFARALPLTDAAQKSTLTKTKRLNHKATVTKQSDIITKTMTKNVAKENPKKYSLLTKKIVNKKPVSAKQSLIKKEQPVVANTKQIKKLKPQTQLRINHSASIDPKIILKQCDAQYKAGNYTKALLACKKAAELNDSHAQFTLGKIYCIGAGDLAADYTNAIQYLNLAAKQNHSQAQFLLALCHQNGIGVKRDSTAALNWYHKAVKNGLPNATKIEENEVIKADSTANISWPGIEEYNTAMNELKHADQHEQALQTMAIAAEKGHPIAQYQLAMQYLQGKHITQDDAKAVEWLKRSADKNYQPAQGYLAWMTMLGLGTKQNNQAAINWFLEAKQFSVNNDYDTSLQEKLSQLTVPTQHIQKRPSNAKQRLAEFRRGMEIIETSGKASPENLSMVIYAAEQNNAEAQAYLASLYKHGEKVPQDIALSASWYQRAANAGNVDAQYALGWHYYYGQGLPKNNELALKWFHQASFAGDVRAKNAEAFLIAQHMPQTHLAPTKMTLGNKVTQKIHENVKGIMNVVGLDRFSGYYK